MRTTLLKAIPPRPPSMSRGQIVQRRCYAVQTPGAATVEVFNSRTKWQQKERAARDVEGSRNVDYLRDEVASRLCERLLVIRCIQHLSWNCAEKNRLGHQPQVSQSPRSRCKRLQYCPHPHSTKSRYRL